MIRLILLTMLLAAMVHPAAADLHTRWMQTYGGDTADGFRQAIPTGDGGFVAVGYTYSFGAGAEDVYVVKTDASGDTLWTRTFGGPSPDAGYGVCETDEGDYVVAGYTLSFGAGGEDVYVIRLDAEGNMLWTRTYGGAALDEARSVCATSDGHVVVAGQTESFGAGLSDVYLLKIDAAGDTAWTRAFGGADSEWADAVCEMADGCYGASGTTGSFTPTRDAYMLEVDPNGVLEWEHSYGSTWLYREDFGVGVAPLADGGMIATGWRTDQDNGDPDQVSFLQVDADGVQDRYLKYSDPYLEYGSSVCVTADGDHLICGASKDPDTHKNDLLILKRGGLGGWLWEQVLGGTGSDWGLSIIPVEPHEYLIAGHTESSGHGSFDGWLVRMFEPQASAPEGNGSNQLRLEVPSPCLADGATIRFHLPARMNVQLTVHDVRGRTVRTLHDGALDSGDHAMTWEGEDARPGVYWARLLAGGTVTTRKLVRMR